MQAHRETPRRPRLALGHLLRLSGMRGATAKLSVVLVLGLVLVAVFAPQLAPYAYDAQEIPRRLEGPSADYLLGTDHLGRDLLSRVIHGTRIALLTALPAIGLALAAGTILGLLAGYLGGIIDAVIVLLLDTLQAFPGIILALAILALVGPSFLVVVLGVAFIPGYARVVRAQVLSARSEPYVQAERGLGAGNGRILFRHILPNVLSPVVVLAAMDLPSVITLEAGLSFLGMGVKPPTPSWGVMLSEGFRYLRHSPWQIVWAGLALMATTLAITLFGEALRDRFDPRSPTGRQDR